MCQEALVHNISPILPWLFACTMSHFESVSAKAGKPVCLKHVGEYRNEGVRME